MESSRTSPATQAPRTGGVRFAPSPTGRFHIGNLRTAWISHRFAKVLKAPWVVRVEDIDTPRVLPGAQDQQLEDMKALGMEPDFLVVQSQFRPRHWKLFAEGIRSGQIYPCDCSRTDVQSGLAGIASAPHDGVAPVYTGRCRPLAAREFKAIESLGWRFRMPKESGHDDFIIARSKPDLDGGGLPVENSFVPAYHWACAIDDWDGGYDLLVRSADLAHAAVFQRAIQRWVSWLEGQSRVPAVFHTSLVVQNDGHRLEKRTKGVTLPEVLANGISLEELVERFEKSFDPSLLNWVPLPGIEAGESRAKLTLSDLGF